MRLKFIVVIDRSSSMAGRPWEQVQQALVKMIQMIKCDANIELKVLAYNSATKQLQLTGEVEHDQFVVRGVTAYGSTSFISRV